MSVRVRIRVMSMRDFERAVRGNVRAGEPVGAGVSSPGASGCEGKGKREKGRTDCAVCGVWFVPVVEREVVQLVEDVRDWDVLERRWGERSRRWDERRGGGRGGGVHGRGGGGEGRGGQQRIGGGGGRGHV